MLADALRFVPYCDAHKSVWSPPFTQIILEAASQVDSLWKATRKHCDPSADTDRLIITDHHREFGSLVATQRVVFFGCDPAIDVCPFEPWQQPNYQPLDWWTAYNKLKHDRFSSQTYATLNNAVSAVAALLLAVIYCGECDTALIAADLLDTTNQQFNPQAYSTTTLLRDVRANGHAKIETKLFAHPIGVFNNDDTTRPWAYFLTDSPRFGLWWALNGNRFMKPAPPATP